MLFDKNHFEKLNKIIDFKKIIDFNKLNNLIIFRNKTFEYIIVHNIITNNDKFILYK